MSKRNHAATVRTLNARALRCINAAIDASMRGEQAHAAHRNIQLIREHMRHYPATPEGRIRHARALKTIAHLRTLTPEETPS